MACMKLRFSIRDLILVTIMAAMAAGWWLDHARLAQLAEHPNDIEYRHIQAAMKVQEYENKVLKRKLEQLEAAK